MNRISFNNIFDVSQTRKVSIMSNIADSFKQFYAKDRQTWRKWLAKNHNSSPGIWLVYYKKDSGKTRVAYADAVEEALCFGWIDATVRPGDNDHYIQLFTPRKPKSGWSQINKGRIERLINEGLMTDAGQVKIDEAKKNGTWAKLDAVESMTIPPELEKEFKKSKKVKSFFDSLSKTGKKMVLYRLNAAKRPETKAKRMAEFIEAAKQQKNAR